MSATATAVPAQGHLFETTAGRPTGSRKEPVLAATGKYDQAQLEAAHVTLADPERYGPLCCEIARRTLARLGAS